MERMSSRPNRTVPKRQSLLGIVFLGIFLITDLACAQIFSGPSTRRTSLVLSEIHYHPAGDSDPSAEFIELYNSSPIRVDLSGYQLRGDADYDLPDGTTLEGGSSLIIAATPALYQDQGITVLGPWSGFLPNDSGTVRLRKPSGGIVLETNYRNNARWPQAADGAGHSLVLARPSYGEGQVEAWADSANPGGSPGIPDPASNDSLSQVIISEVLSTGSEFIELHNPGPNPVDLSGCALSNHPDLPGFIIPNGTMLGVGNDQAFPNLGFPLDELGDRIYFRAPDQARVITSRKIGGQESGHSWGGLTNWRELTSPTPGLTNAAPLHRQVVINELHYHPTGGSNEGEFIELFNRGPGSIDLSNWTLEGGINFTFPEETSILENEFLVIAKDRTVLLSIHPTLSTAAVLGDFSGKLSNAGERIALVTAGNVTVDEVAYHDGGRWPDQPDGGGTTLQLVDVNSDNALAPNWTAGDESASAETITLEHTGVLDLGHQKAPTATRFFILLGGKGEAIIDDVEVIYNGQNLVSNHDFENGETGWKFFGTHEPSRVENGELRVIATDEGNLANLVDTTLTSEIPPGATVTLRATCRWVSGNPDILLGLNGGWLEAAGTLPVPTDVGTPGAANFSSGNIGPAITEISHSPLLPQVGEPITIHARIDDPDGITTARLRYRFDPSNSLQQITMTDAGDGFFTATIPAQNSAKMVAFHILTLDAASAPLSSTFPSDAPDRECLVKIGEVTPPGAFSTMRIWITNDTLTEWRDRTRSSNRDLDATFVSDGRAFYNAGVRYAGSDGGVTIYDSPIGNPTGYNVTLQNDDVFLNVQRLTIDRETTRDATRQRERLLFWFLEKLGLPNLHRRYVHVYLNGIERDNLIMEDVQKPNADVMDEWFADKGRLTKTNPWFEFDADSKVINTNPGPKAITNRLQHYLTTDGSKKLPRYRWTWTHGAGHDNAHDFSGIFDLIDATESPESELVSRMRQKADLTQWMRTFAANDLGSYWDTFGNPASKNAYLFESLETGRWSVIVWDMDVGLGVFNAPFNAALFPANVDDNIKRLYDQPAVVRDYWRALDESLNSFFTATPGSPAHDILSETYDALIANGAPVTSPFVASGPDGLSVDDWINMRRDFLLGEIADKEASFTASAPSTSDGLFTIVSGTLPLSATRLTANGVPLQIDFSAVHEWSARLALQPGENTIVIDAYDQSGITVGSETLTITYTGTDPWPGLKINEWMASNPAGSPFIDPADGQADDWFELYNPTSTSFPLDGWFLSDDPDDPFKFLIPDGFTIPANGFLLVWADDETGQNAPFIRQEIHTSLKLATAGDSIILTAPDSTPIDRVDFQNQAAAISQHRSPDGSSRFSFTTSATPAATNGPERSPAPVHLTLSPSNLLSFASHPGEIYQLESSPDLLNWTIASPPLAGDGSTITLSKNPAPNPRSFYRIKSY